MPANAGHTVAAPWERGSPSPSANQRAASLFLGNDEPGIEEIISDEIVRRVMDRDGVDVSDLLGLMATMRGRLSPRA